jgi:single-stranded-DNA-specific exonuclease
MLRSKTRWRIHPQSDAEAKKLSEATGVSPRVAQLLLNRGITSVEAAERFLYIEKQDFYDPFLMKGMKETVERIQLAISNREKILIFGDYDADGVSSTSLMMYTLTELDADVDYYIPNRFTEGYGPNEAAIRRAKEQGYSLVVTVDTGIAAVDEAVIAKEIGLDFIVTDHHEPPPVLPAAYSIVNPKQKDCLYPFKGLAGVGVAFKVAHALFNRVPEHLLDIAVLGTIADLVPLIEENRLLASKGIKAITLSEKPGLRALIHISGHSGKDLTAEDVGFALGPRLNAAGRLDSANPAVELLLSNDEEEAHELAKNIDMLNRERQTLVNDMTKEAIEEIENEPSFAENIVCIVAKEGWNPGVIGIVASRIVEKYYRPTIVIGIDGNTGLAKGSARSIEGFDMFRNLSTCRDILPHFGGHPMAAGMTLEAADIEELRGRLNELAAKSLSEKDLTPIKTVDLTLNLEEITLETIAEIHRLAPYGVQNPTPKILLEDKALTEIKQIGSDKNHLKIIFEEDGSKLDSVGFRLGEIFHEVSDLAKLSAVGKLSINEWNGFRKPQLILEDAAIRDWQLFDCRGEYDLKKKLQTMPKDKLLLVAFREDTIEKLDLHDWLEQSVIISRDGIPADYSNRYVILLDLPYEKNRLSELFEQKEMPERIYAIFNQTEKHFFSTIPSREHFKWYYAFLTKRGSFDLNAHAERLAKARGWSKETIAFMSDIFAELGFIEIDNGSITIVSQPAKRELSESALYRGKQEQAAIENDLCYSSYSSLKKWFDDINLGSKKLQEAVQ